MDSAECDHYAALGLDRRCTIAQIRAAYRLMSKRHHPDVNPDSPNALARSQELNAAYSVLGDPARRRAYDRELRKNEAPVAPSRTAKNERNLSQDARLRIEDFIRGTSLNVRVNDPANPEGAEIYQLAIPPETATGTRFRVPRAGPFAGGFVDIRVRAFPGFRFKVRGADLRCDLRINARRAVQGGVETITGATGKPLRITIPSGVPRGQTLRVAGEGMPKPRGGRGDLLVRITYRPEVRVSRSS